MAGVWGVAGEAGAWMRGGGKGPLHLGLKERSRELWGRGMVWMKRWSTGRNDIKRTGERRGERWESAGPMQGVGGPCGRGLSAEDGDHRQKQEKSNMRHKVLWLLGEKAKSGEG
ncbi:hypothetical protein cyc_04691 [Cyclospora cayetanensis]|uniref:Uncharacterized protein n=1 Tax=Cyclospora cayetanensis TaxID=88456 RepID=A0A1D3CRH2_9EIME|nr:hypothetical protein cyc_04691 [Cyclospora cayetanensis]